jgi:hypothetical protein
MRHIKPIGQVKKPQLAQDIIWCQIAAILASIGITPPKDFIEKCIGF